jgi:hypothetical protein
MKLRNSEVEREGQFVAVGRAPGAKLRADDGHREASHIRRSTPFRLLLAFSQFVLLGLALIGYQSLSAKANLNQTKKGDKLMTSHELIEALRQLDTNQESAIDELAKAFEEHARAPVRIAVAMLNDRDPRMSERAAALITNVRDLAILPILESPDPAEAADKVWNMDVVLTAHLAVRGQLVQRLNSMMSDKKKIPWGKLGPGEGAPAPSRTCDEAYLMMRRLLNTNEDKVHFAHERKAFLGLSDVEKDNEIQKAKKSHVWTNLVEGLD